MRSNGVRTNFKKTTKTNTRLDFDDGDLDELLPLDTDTEETKNGQTYIDFLRLCL